MRRTEVAVEGAAAAAEVVGIETTVGGCILPTSAFACATACACARAMLISWFSVSWSIWPRVGTSTWELGEGTDAKSPCPWPWLCAESGDHSSPPIAPSPPTTE